MPAASKPGCRALRRGRVSIPGQFYSLTAVTAGRRALLSDFFCARAVIDVVRGLNAEAGIDTRAIMVMPDHVHWLLELGPVPLHRLVQRFKARSARRINQLRGERQRVWQPGYHDHAVRSEENLAALARYIVMNPVRAGLVASVVQYPHWDCAWL